MYTTSERATARPGFSSRTAGSRRAMAEDGKGRSGQDERYRQAAIDALEMLDWCIGYLVGTHKDRIATQLARNRSYIREQLMREPEEPVPTSQE
jgi:hypothetical protein